MAEVNWIYRGKPFAEKDANNYIGFLYNISHKTSYRFYIGIKLFWSLANGKKSNFRKYLSSSDIMRQIIRSEGIDSFSFTILELHKFEAKLRKAEMREFYRIVRNGKTNQCYNLLYHLDR